MPRNGSGVASAVPGFNSVAASTTILSALHNSGINDLISMFNTAWPTSLGGTGGTSVITSWDALTAEGSVVPSASTLVLTTATGPRIDISGTTTITAVTLAAGTMRIARATGIFQITASASLLVNKSASGSYTTAVGDLLFFQADGAVVSVTVLGTTSPVTVTNEPFRNLSLVASVGSSALTIALKGADGNDPSATNPVYVSFRSATAASGANALLMVTAPTSIVVSSGSTLGMTSAVAATLAIVAFNDAGTFRLGIINPNAFPIIDGIASSTAEGGAGAADSAGVYYTGTAVTSKAFTVLGFAMVTEATAGTWASVPSTLQVANSAISNNAYSATGTFTPGLTFGGGSTGMTFSSRSGVYTKIGNLVYVNIIIVLSAKGSSTGSAVITGLPFTAAGQSGITVSNYSGTTGITSMFGDTSTTTIALLAFAATAAANLTEGNFNNNTAIIMSGCFSV